MRRVAVIGCGGAGKSTLARRLRDLTGLPLHHLDALYYGPGWEPMAEGPWRALQERLVAGPEWICDGNYLGTMDIRLRAADTAVFLAYPRLLCLGRAIRRRLGTRPDPVPGCPERLTGEFARWIWAYPARVRPRVTALLREAGAGTRVVALNGPREAERWLREVAGG